MWSHSRTRRVVQLGLTANALHPPRRGPLVIPAFFAAWLTGELAPHLLALTVADTARWLVSRKGRADRVGIVLSAASAAGLGALIATSQRARGEVERALDEGIGTDYAAELEHPPSPADLATPWGQLAMPFRMRDRDVRRDRDIAYAPGGKRFLLDIFRPRHAVTGAPVLLHVHGGGWVIGNKEQQGLPLMLHMAKRGWICVTINYPLSPAAKWPEHIVAAKRAVAWIKDNIADYGGDPSFLAVTGGSAGGHLAALLALTANDPATQPGFEDADTSVQACVPHYGVYDFAATSGSRESQSRLKNLIARLIFDRDKGPERFLDDYIAASPWDRITDKAPPFFVIHGSNDTLVPVREGREFARKLREVSASPVAYAEISGAEHAFDVFPSIRSAHVVRGVERFLEWTYRKSGKAPVQASPRRTSSAS